MIGGRLDQVPVRDIEGTLAVGYADLAQASGIPGLQISPVGNELRVSGRIQLPTGQVEASARGTVSVADDDLVINADEAQVNGVELPAAVLATAARLLSFRVSPRSLPLALRITGVQILPDRLTVAARAQNVVLRRGEISVTR
jgi:hypothetical protein